MNIQTPHSHTSDPVSSHLAGEKATASQQRKKHLDIVVSLVKENQGLTGAELAELCDLDKYEVRRRLSDANGVLVKQGKSRTCGVAKTMAVTWWMR